MIENQNKYALVTGASKGLGYEYCEQLLKKNYNIIGVARNTSSLKKLQEKYRHLDIQTWNFDLSVIENNHKLFNEAKKFNVEILINNAGFGVWGPFDETNLEDELNMIDLNIKSLHILTKYFTKYFAEKNSGRVLNIGSVLAAHSPAPVFSSYYASKAYVWSLSAAINTELKKKKSKVRVITLCPGQLKTDFWNRGNNKKTSTDSSAIKGMKIEVYAARSLKIGLKANRRNSIVIGLKNKFAVKFAKWAPKNIVLSSIYKYQKNR